MNADAILPCPFCGHVGLEFSEGSTFRWLAYSCGGCGMGSETRVQTMGAGSPEQWRQQAERDAIADWNKRADAQKAAPPQPERTRSQKLADAGFTRRPSLWALEAREALELIAAPRRPDGTWNRDREACRQLAVEVLGRDEAAPPAAQPARVRLVATGETHEGRETYTRHEGGPPPLCDHETLLAAPAEPAPSWWHCQTHGPATANAWGCPECVREMRGELAALRAAEPAPALPAGFVLVPVEPTPKMISAGWIDKEDTNPEDIWAAMLAAAAQEQTARQAEQGEPR